MKLAALHAGSVAFGAGMACVGLVVLGVGGPQVLDHIGHGQRPVDTHVVGIPDPRDAVLIAEGIGPFTVPDNKLLVITGLNCILEGYVVELLIDSVSITRAVNQVVAFPPPGIPVRGGSTVWAFSGTGQGIGRAIGYLIDDRQAPRVLSATAPATTSTVVAGIPDPRSAVLLREEVPYTVPDGKKLVVTGGWHRTWCNNRLTIDVDGVGQVLFFLIGDIQAISPPGMVVDAGSVVTALSNCGPDYGRALGYLIDE